MKILEYGTADSKIVLIYPMDDHDLDIFGVEFEGE